ncbi:RNA binding protein [Atractiella rhizophila]|nr:RNA binding protein [Atractiella rhizophila]
MNPNKKLYVGNLPYNLDHTTLRTLFVQYGAIQDCVIMMEKDTPNKSRGYGFVTFRDQGDAMKACTSLNGFHIDGRALVVDFADPSREKQK